VNPNTIQSREELIEKLNCFCNQGLASKERRSINKGAKHLTTKVRPEANVVANQNRVDDVGDVGELLVAGSFETGVLKSEHLLILPLQTHDYTYSLAERSIEDEQFINKSNRMRERERERERESLIQLTAER
jgi:hypothetical protein